ncbi:MAG: ribonuclease J [Eubacteriales bacterium]|nr:ribonuclease J [Eubacteriales bacterium]
MPIKQNNSRGGASEKSQKPAVTASAGGSADRTIAADKSSKKSDKPKSIQNKKQNPAGSNTKNSKNKQAAGKSSDALKQSSGKNAGKNNSGRVKSKSKSKSVDVTKNKSITTDGLLKITPLGGMREIGKNMTAIEYADEMIIVDCGMGFPEEDMPGIDVVIPDFSYISQNKDKLKGVFLTHGHEDHIGALPWFCKEFNVPIYGNKLTIELVRLKLDDRGIGAKNVILRAISDGDRIDAGCFNVEFIHTNHSIADANALAIRTPAGIVFHSGDFKIDYTPIHGGPADLARIAQIGAEGVLLMIADSTNVERSGFTSSERKVGETFADLFAKADGRIFVATFSSNIFRLQQIFTAAEMYGRKVALLGRSMLNVFKAANSLGYIKMEPDTLIDINQIDKYDSDELVFITTGSQGEPMSALTRMAFSEHRRVEIIPGDTVILSSSAIPGNEKPIYRVINELFKRGAHVIYESLSEIHVSGHAYKEELKLLHQLVKPKYFIPGHGEYRHLYKHAELANSMGTPWENIFLLNNGDMFEYRQGQAKIGGFTNAAGVLIDGSGMGDVDSLVLRDRRLLADDGIVAVFIAIDAKTGNIIGQPDLQAKGFIYESEVEKILNECRRKITQFAVRADNSNKPLAAMIKTGALRDQLRDLLFERTRRRPMILVSVIEV